MKTEFEPSKSAEGVLGVMVGHDDIKREILWETLDSEANGQILESGRTLCDSVNQIKGPIDRFPKAVDLQQCPISGTGGIWHTHVTPQEMLNPSNSLPDIAAVVLGHVDVVSVIGSETGEYVLSTEDDDAMVDAFSDAIGERIETQEDLIDAISYGRIDPYTARQRVRDRFSDLIVTKETGYDDITAEIKDRHNIKAESTQAYERVELSMVGALQPEENVPDIGAVDYRFFDYSTAMATPKGCTEATSLMADESVEKLGELVPISVYETAMGAAIGTIVGNLVESTFFSD